MKTKTKLLPLITLTLSFAIANTVSASFFQGFETDNDGWYNATRIASMADGIASKTGSWHAHADGSTYTYWGGISSSFPLAGYITRVSVYLDTTGAGAADDTRFDWTSAINGPDCLHRRDFVFNAGFYNDTAPYGSGPGIVISASNNGGRSGAFPKNPAMSPIKIPTSGWYTLEHQFNNVGGVLSVTMRLLNSTGVEVASWIRSDPTDTIGTYVRGNRYGWFDLQEFLFLAIDDSALDGIQNYCQPGSGPAGSAGYWQNHPDAWCVPSITIGNVFYTEADAIAAMQHAANKDMTYQMFAQLVAAELNVNCLHSDQTCVIDAIQAADAWMADHNVGSNVAAKSSAWKAITSAYNSLVNYNTGTLCAPPLP